MSPIRIHSNNTEMITLEWNWRQYRERDTLLWEWNSEFGNLPLWGPWQTSNILFCVHFATLLVNTNCMASNCWKTYGWWIRRIFKETVSDESKCYPTTCLGRQNEITKNLRISDDQARPRTRPFLNISLDRYRYMNCSVQHVIKRIEDVVLLI
jgi:hypothetical protein